MHMLMYYVQIKHDKSKPDTEAYIQSNRSANKTKR